VTAYFVRGKNNREKGCPKGENTVNAHKLLVKGGEKSVKAIFKGSVREGVGRSLSKTAAAWMRCLTRKGGFTSHPKKKTMLNF